MIKFIMNMLDALTFSQHMLIFVASLSIFLVAKKLIDKALNVEHYNVYRKRERQLDFNEKKKYDNSTKELIDKAINPVYKIFGNNFSFGETSKLQKDLEFVGWDKYLNANQFKALQVSFFVGSIVVGYIFMSITPILGVFTFAFINYLPIFVVKNEVKDTKFKILSEFPDFIRIVQGYLASGYSLLNAFESSLPFLEDTWKNILGQVIVDMKLTNSYDALNRMKQKIDIPQVREFIAIVVLTIDQGGSPQEAFESQANEVRSLMKYLMESKIVKRNAYAQILQPVLLIAFLAAFAGPMFAEMFTMF